MGENHGLFGIKARSQVINDHVCHVILNVRRGVAIGNHLVVGDNDVCRNALVLQAHALFDGAEVMAHVQTPRRTIAREHRVFLGMNLKVRHNGIAALLTCFKAIFTHSALFR